MVLAVGYDLGEAMADVPSAYEIASGKWAPLA